MGIVKKFKIGAAWVTDVATLPFRLLCHDVQEVYRTATTNPSNIVNAIRHVSNELAAPVAGIIISLDSPLSINTITGLLAFSYLGMGYIGAFDHMISAILGYKDTEKFEKFPRFKNMKVFDSSPK